MEFIGLQRWDLITIRSYLALGLVGLCEKNHHLLKSPLFYINKKSFINQNVTQFNLNEWTYM